MDTYPIEECDFPEMTVLAVRTKDSLKAMGKYIRELYSQARMKSLVPDGPVCAVYFEKPTNPDSVDYEMALPVEGAQEEMDKLTDLGGDHCLKLRVKGSYAKLAGAYDYFTSYIEKGGYELSGPPREVYVRGPFLGLPTAVTDIYFPIKGKAA
jgi:Transcriptional regulator, effector-binding domain/component